MHTLSRLDSLVLATLATTVIGCGASSEPEPGPSTIFIGQMATTSIAVVEGADGTALVYLCDGVQSSAWFFGKLEGNALTATSEDGGTVQATLAGNQITGQVQLPGQAAATFSASRATGVAGIYLVEQSPTQAHGFSAVGGELDADLTGTAVSGTVRPADGDAIALSGNVKSFGEASGVATWIVQADGSVSGKVTNTAGGGNCSIWSKMKQVMFGVDCSFF
jgi:hypothetical protein